MCELCAPGSFSTASAATVCTPCAPGYYTDLAGSQQCQPCPVNTYNPAERGASLTACLACPSNTVTHGTGSVDELQCVAAPGFVTVQPGELLPGDTVATARVAQPCGAGFNCTFGAPSVAAMAVLPGYWRSTSWTWNVRVCQHAVGCAGGTMGGADMQSLCAMGHTGPCVSFPRCQHAASGTVVNIVFTRCAGTARCASTGGRSRTSSAHSVHQVQLWQH